MKKLSSNFEWLANAKTDMTISYQNCVELCSGTFNCGEWKELIQFYCRFDLEKLMEWWVDVPFELMKKEEKNSEIIEWWKMRYM